MTDAAIPRTIARRGRHRRQASHTVPTVVAVLTTLVGLSLVGFLLWPNWNGAMSTIDPGRLPVMVGDVLFNVPTQAVRVKMQRRTGPQDRIDLIFAYPDLTPPASRAHVAGDPSATEAPVEHDRIFVSIAAHGGTLSPQERVKVIYPRYLHLESATEQDGLRRISFRDATPYRNEDLFDDGRSFAARCSRDAATPGMCLFDMRIDGADLTFRFPRAWLGSWREVARNIERLAAMLRSPGAR
jgi:hypothetical protein